MTYRKRKFFVQLIVNFNEIQQGHLVNNPDFNIHTCIKKLNENQILVYPLYIQKIYFNNSCLMALVVQNLVRRRQIGYHHRVHLHGRHHDRRVYLHHHGVQKC